MDLQNQAILWSEPELVGWVEKRGDRSTTWNRRFFLLQGSYLFYYIKNTDISTTEPVGVIPLEDASIKAEDDSDTGRQFCFLLQLGSELATFAKRGSYHISAPSQEAKVVWMHALKMASCSLTYFIAMMQQNQINSYIQPSTMKYIKLPLSINRGELQVIREKASVFDILLAESSSNAKELQRCQGHEGNVLKKEINRVTEAYKKLKEETIETCIEADKINNEAIQTLTIWEIYRDYVLGKNYEGNCYTINKLDVEAIVINNLYKLLIAKRHLIGGVDIKNLNFEALKNINAICKRGLKNIMERQFQTRIKGPRYTLSVHLALMPEGCMDPIARISHPLDMHKRISSIRHKKKNASFEMPNKNIDFKKDLMDNVKEVKFLKSNEISLKSMKLTRTPQFKTMDVTFESNKSNTIFKNDKDIEKSKSKLDDARNLDKKEAINKIEVDKKNIEDCEMNQLRFKKKTLQKSSEHWFNTIKKPSKSLSSLQKCIFQSCNKAKTSIKGQSSKLTPVLQKQVSFLQLNSIQSQPYFQDAQTNNFKSHLTTSCVSKVAMKDSNSVAAIPCSSFFNQFQLLTKPRWLQLRPQKFNIVGPTSIHTYNSLCSSSNIDFCNMQEMQSKDKQRTSGALEANEPLKVEHKFFIVSSIDGHQKKDLHKLSATTLKNDWHQLRKEDNFLRSNVNQYSIIKEQTLPTHFTTCGSPFTQDYRSFVPFNTKWSQMKVDFVPSTSNQRSVCQEQNLNVNHEINHHSLNKKYSLVASNLDWYQPHEDQRPHLIVSKSSPYIEAIIPSKVQALVQQTQLEIHSSCCATQNIHAFPSAMIISNKRKKISPPCIVPLSTPHVTNLLKLERNCSSSQLVQSKFLPMQSTSNFLNSKSDHQNMKKNILLGDSIFIPPLASRYIWADVLPNLRPKFNMHHLLRTNTRKRDIISFISKNKVRNKHQSTNLRGFYQHTSNLQHFPHQCIKCHHFYPYEDHFCIQNSFPYKFQRIPLVDYTNDKQRRLLLQQLCHHQCQYHLHKHSTCHYN